MELAVGIDVGGPHNGYHAALLERQQSQILDLLHFKEPAQLCQHLCLLAEQRKASIKAIAIDAPPAAFISTRNTRLAELELQHAGYNLRRTPYQKEKSPEWMQNSTRLWNELTILFLIFIYWNALPARPVQLSFIKTFNYHCACLPDATIAVTLMIL